MTTIKSKLRRMDAVDLKAHKAIPFVALEDAVMLFTSFHNLVIDCEDAFKNTPKKDALKTARAAMAAWRRDLGLSKEYAHQKLPTSFKIYY